MTATVSCDGHPFDLAISLPKCYKASCVLTTPERHQSYPQASDASPLKSEMKISLYSFSRMLIIGLLEVWQTKNMSQTDIAKNIQGIKEFEVRYRGFDHKQKFWK